MRAWLWMVPSLIACGDNNTEEPGLPSECQFRTEADAIATPQIDTPRWAFRPWISKDISDRDDTLAFVGLTGLALMAGFVVKNLTDDLLFRSNAKEFWVLSAMLVGYGARLARRDGTQMRTPLRAA